MQEAIVAQHAPNAPVVGRAVAMIPNTYLVPMHALQRPLTRFRMAAEAQLGSGGLGLAWHPNRSWQVDKASSGALLASGGLTLVRGAPMGPLDSWMQPSSYLSAAGCLSASSSSGGLVKLPVVCSCQFPVCPISCNFFAFHPSIPAWACFPILV